MTDYMKKLAKRGAAALVLPGLCAFLLAGCPVLEDPETEGLIVRRDDSNREVVVVTIDPGETIYVSVFDPSGIFRQPASAAVDRGAVRVSETPAAGVFGIHGAIPGGKGTVRFSAIGDSATLRVFVRNWASSEVYRRILDPDPVNYPSYFGPLGDPGGAHWYDSAAFGGPHNITRGMTLEERGAPFAPSRWGAYRLIVDRGWHYESPSGFSHPVNGVHTGDLRETAFRQAYRIPHILQVPDSFLRNYVFEFNLHEQSGDLIGFDDRQRLELKTMNNIPNDCRNMRSYGVGETFTFRWKFKIPRDFRVSTEFAHVFQLKNEGGDGGNPIFTLTGRRRNDTNRDVMQLIYRGPTRATVGDKEIPSANWIAKEVPLDLFRGEWVRAEVFVTYDDPGAFRISVVRLRDMREIMAFAFCPVHFASLGLLDPFMTYRPGNSYARPKFGLYRRIVHMTPFGVPDMYIDRYGTPDFERSRFVQAFMSERGGKRWTTTMWFTDIEMDRFRRNDGIVCTVVGCPCHLQHAD